MAQVIVGFLQSTWEIQIEFPLAPGLAPTQSKLVWAFRERNSKGQAHVFFLSSLSASDINICFTFQIKDVLHNSLNFQFDPQTGNTASRGQHQLYLSTVVSINRALVSSGVCLGFQPSPSYRGCHLSPLTHFSKLCLLPSSTWPQAPESSEYVFCNVPIFIFTTSKSHSERNRPILPSLQILQTQLSLRPSSRPQALALDIIMITCSLSAFAHQVSLSVSQKIIILSRTFCRVPGPLGLEPHFVHRKPSIITTIVVIIIIWD